MKTGLKVTVAGSAVLLGCLAVVLSPVEVPFPPEANSAPAAGLARSTTDAVSDEGGQPAPGAGYQDGVYRAVGQGKFGDVPVKVVIEDGAIVSITLGSNSEAPAMLQKAQDEVIPQILEHQSVDGVDVAAGATFTSTAIIEALADVLERAQS